MNGKPLVGILVLGKKKKYLNLYQSYAEKYKIQLFAFTPRDINWQKKYITGLELNKKKWLKTTFPFPVVVYNQGYGGEKNVIPKLEKYIGKNNCFNHVNKFNKWETYQILKRKTELQKYLPATSLYSSVYINEMLKKYKVLYLKPCYGSQGKDVYKIELTPNGDIKFYYHAISSKETFKNRTQLEDKIKTIVGNNQFIIQQEVPMTKYSGNHFDIRVLVQKNSKGNWSISNIVSRIPNKFFYNTSLFQKVEITENILKELSFSKSKIKSVIKTLHDISIRVSKSLEDNLGHLGELSVDFGLDQEGKITIIEVNGKPQKKIYDYLVNPNIKKAIYKRPMQYALYLSQI